MVSETDDVDTIEDYEAFILGSAVYMGAWLEEATVFVLEHKETLRQGPVWLFSSGPIGNPARPADSELDVKAILDAASPRGHFVFAGKLDKKKLNLLEKAIVTVFGAKDGDYRDWDAVRQFAAQVAFELRTIDVPKQSRTEEIA